ncbi:MAG: glycoside hydrolase family 3 C-terminal domain-containing protein [Chloroflexota bacterium]|nr:glycoside hydrolase family 3 C-terminal domain-containing protein [Chloroflexota bacterium]
MPFAKHYGVSLRKLVEAGQVPESLIDGALLRILRTKLRFAQIGEPDRYVPENVVCEEHVALAREAAAKSIVLLKNEPPGDSAKPLLPLDRTNTKRVAVIGVLASKPNTGDQGSSKVRPPYVVTPLQGIQEAFTGGGVQVEYHDGLHIQSAINAALGADVAIIVAGYTHEDEGEYIKFLWISKGGDRDALTLHAHDEALIQAVADANPNTVVVMMGGSAIITEAWRECVPAMLMIWYPGMEGGHALADVLLGEVNPSGKLLCVFPKSEAQLPFFDKNADAIDYDRYHGYRLMDHNGEDPAFPFGFGLSYTTFEYKSLQLDRQELGAAEVLIVSVEITNTGDVAGQETAQLYVGYPGSRVDRPVKELKGFAKLFLQPGETKRVEFELPIKRLAYYNERRGEWVVEAIVYQVFVGGSSREVDLLQGQFRVDDERRTMDD